MLALTVASVGRAAVLPAFWCIPSLVFRGAAASLGIAIVNALGNFGGFIGPTVVCAFKGATGSMNGALLAMAGLALCAGILILAIGRQKAFAAYRRPVAA